MIFLRDNVFLEKDLTFEDVKPRLLGRRTESYLCTYIDFF